MTLAMTSRRHYSSSDGKASEGSEEPVKEEAEGDVSSQPQSETATKLQTKEREVVDLTVRTRVPPSSFNSFIYDSFDDRAAYDTSKQTSSTSSATLHEKKNNSATLQ
jgi:hypothetical protein